MSKQTQTSPIVQSSASLGQRFFAWVTHKTSHSRNERLDTHKRRLFNTLSGTVLEIGPGTGANFDYYPANIRWIGIEPNPAMHSYLRERAEQSDLVAELRVGSAEHLTVPDDSIDAVVCTLVLCSVDSPPVSLREVRRVLRPGGRFIFIEHVAAPQGTTLRTVQNFIKPVWNIIADGCHPNRETWRDLKQAGFSHLTYEEFTLKEGMSSLMPLIAGVAIK
ncbi:MAG: class I SAM-dependent methyltransferase [Anaerolineae bacterium]|nr:class I SAM-dependent methyltransferase [Anaerolineae bacterium]